jgi:hypothetical protein
LFGFWGWAPRLACARTPRWVVSAPPAGDFWVAAGRWFAGECMRLDATVIPAGWRAGKREGERTGRPRRSLLACERRSVRLWPPHVRDTIEKDKAADRTRACMASIACMHEPKSFHKEKPQIVVILITVLFLDQHKPKSSNLTFLFYVAHARYSLGISSTYLTPQSITRCFKSTVQW